VSNSETQETPTEVQVNIPWVQQEKIRGSGQVQAHTSSFERNKKYTDVIVRREAM
jgi:hypothetical protein